MNRRVVGRGTQSRVTSATARAFEEARAATLRARAAPSSARRAGSRESPRRGWKARLRDGDDVVRLTGDVEAEAESGVVTPVAPQTAEGRVWFSRPPG